MMCCKKATTEHPVGPNPLTTVGETAALPKLKCLGNCERCKKKQESRKTELLKKGSVAMAFMLMTTAAFAENGAVPEVGFWTDPFNSPKLPLYFMFFAVTVIFILAVAVMFITYRVVHELIRLADEGIAAKEGRVYVPEKSLFEKWWLRINAIAPLENEKDIELDHSFDGIRELDNHLPPWWKGLFFASIVFGAVYMIIFHTARYLPLSGQEYANEIAAAQEQIRLRNAAQPEAVIDENQLVYDRNAAFIERGRIVFTSNGCGSCHRNDAGGNIGPNLTDAYWLHGGSVKNIFATIRDGVVEKAMPAWGKVMSLKDVRDVTFYVMSLQGTKPANPKAPQGDLFILKPDSAQHEKPAEQALLKK